MKCYYEWCHIDQDLHAVNCTVDLSSVSSLTFVSLLILNFSIGLETFQCLCILLELYYAHYENQQWENLQKVFPSSKALMWLCISSLQQKYAVTFVSLPSIHIELELESRRWKNKILMQSLISQNLAHSLMRKVKSWC